MPGVIERVIENWLTSANERSYHIPFCQLLAAEGEPVIHVSPHGPFEQGKDVITIDKKGKLRAYQLKQGDIGLAEWRKNGSEQECVEGRILGCFPEDDKVGLGRRHPLRFQQEVMEVLVAPASP